MRLWHNLVYGKIDTVFFVHRSGGTIQPGNINIDVCDLYKQTVGGTPFCFFFLREQPSLGRLV